MKHLKTSLYFVNYLLILLLLWPISLFSYKIIQKIAKSLANLLFYLPFIKKRLRSNITIALKIKPDEIDTISKASLTRLITTLLEFLKINREKNLENIITCINPEVSDELVKNNKGAVIFCGHLGNWEMMFLERTQYIDSIAIGRPIKNPFLYKLITKVRERFKTKMFPPKKALKESLRALKQNKFVGLVADQALLDEGIEITFFNQSVLSSPSPATLAYKTNVALIPITNVCINGHYYTKFHPPIYKDESLERRCAIKKMTQQAFLCLESEIKKHPEQYLWLHNRFKRKCNTSKKFRSEINLIIIAANSISKHLAELNFIEKNYPNSENYLYVHEKELHLAPKGFQIKSYKTIQELFFIDYRYKLLFNFTNNEKLSNHFLNQSVSNVINTNNFNILKGSS